MHTSDSSYHTPAADVTEWELFVIFFYLLNVVYKVICAISLVNQGQSIIVNGKTDGAIQLYM